MLCALLIKIDLKTKFFILTVFLLFSRACDFYSTSLWYFDNPSHESNPLSRIFGLGWSGLIISNVIIVSIIIYSFYIYTYQYTIQKLPNNPQKLTDYISELYYNEHGKFYQVFYKMPKSKKVLLAHGGYVMVRVVSIASLLATAHNLLQYYSNSYYFKYSQIVKYPVYVIYILVLLAMVYFTSRLWKKEYKSYSSSYLLSTY